MPPDVFKVLKDLELKAVGLDPNSKKMNEGYFTSFRSIGLPIHMEDYKHPWSPSGGNLASNINKILDKDVPKSDPVDPKNAPKTGSGNLKSIDSESLTDDTMLIANIAESEKTYLNTFMLVDRKIKMSNDYSVIQNASTVSDSWYAIITGANGIPTQSVLNDDMKKAYEEAQSKLMDKDGNPTPHYEAYMQYYDEWHSKKTRWDKAYADAFTDPMKLQNWPIVGTDYQDAADTAMDRWVSFGFKQEIENALAILAAQGTDPAIAMISRAKKRYINSLNEFTSVGELPYTFMLPGSWYDRDNDDGWNIYTSDDFHSETHYTESSTSYGGGGGFNLGFWSVGGGASHSENANHFDLKVEDLSIEFSFCAVEVIRPWLVATLLNLHNWFLMGDYKKNCISNGQMSQELPNPQSEFTFFPSYMTSLILIKDVKIHWANIEGDYDSFETATHAEGHVGWGPIRVGGSYDHHGKRVDSETDVSRRGLEAPGIQLVGYVSTIVPACPSVDSSTYLNKPNN